MGAKGHVQVSVIRCTCTCIIFIIIILTPFEVIVPRLTESYASQVQYVLIRGVHSVLLFVFSPARPT